MISPERVKTIHLFKVITFKHRYIKITIHVILVCKHVLVDKLYHMIYHIQNNVLYVMQMKLLMMLKLLILFVQVKGAVLHGPFGHLRTRYFRKNFWLGVVHCRLSQNYTHGNIQETLLSAFIHRQVTYVPYYFILQILLILYLITGIYSNSLKYLSNITIK